jgi:hypothetical protein
MQACGSQALARAVRRNYDPPVAWWDRIGRPGRAALLVAVGAAGGAASLALASVPDAGTGVIHACYAYTLNSAQQTVPTTTDQNFHIVDPSLGQSCSTNPAAGLPEATLDFNQQGPQGVSGAQGPPGNPGTPGTLTITSPPVSTGETPIGQAVLRAPGLPALSLAIISLGGPGQLARKVPGFHKYESVTLQRGYVNASAFSDWINGVHFSEAVITLASPAAAELQIKLSNVVISAYELGSAPSGKGKIESITLSYKAIRISAKPIPRS